MCDLAGREAEKAEDDVLDPRLDEVLAVGDDLRRVFAEKPQDDGEVVDAERPEGVLVRADHAEVLAVAVDAGHVAELAGVDELLHLAQARVIEEEVARHQDAVVRTRERDELLHLLTAHRRRLLDEDVLARLERLFRKRIVRRNGRRDRDGLDRVVGKRVGKRAGHRRLRIPRRVVGLAAFVGVDHPRELRELADHAHDVLAPAADSGVGDAGHNFQTFSSLMPSRPRALRRSTTRFASATSFV